MSNSAMAPLVECWREIHGANHWKNLLPATGGESVNENLRSEIIKYGEFAQACQDCYEFDESSTQCGNSRYSKGELLARVGLPNTGYEITKYIYATSSLWLPGFFKQPQTAEDTWSRDSNWIGFIAVATSEEEIKRLGRRDIVIAWRGTVSRLEWIEDIKDVLKPSGLDPHDDLTRGVEVEAGFLDIYTSHVPNSRYNHQSVRYQILFEINRLLNVYKNEELSVTVTGHSLGGALALLCAYDIAELGVNTSQLSPLPTDVKHLSPHLISPHKQNMAKASRTVYDSSELKERSDQTKIEAKHEEAMYSPSSEAETRLDKDTLTVTEDKSKSTLVKNTITVKVEEKAETTPTIPVTVFSFSAPRVGDADFKGRCDELGIKVLRVLNREDIVPKVPGVIINENVQAFVLRTLDMLPWTYSHVGTCFELDSKISPYLREDEGVSDRHNLEALLHLVDGYQGPNKPFAPSGKRDLKLINKSSDFLKPELGVPAHWRK